MQTTSNQKRERRTPVSGARGLIGHALAARDSEERWQWVTQLHRLATKEVLDHAMALAQGRSADERILAADILGQLGHPPVFAEEQFDGISLLLRDKRRSVIAAAITAAGHLFDPRFLGQLLEFAGHPSPSVREAVAFSLLSAVEGPPDPRALRALVRLTRDERSSVREWATVSLGRLVSVDSPEIRAALRARLKDRPSIRAEALIGLASRRDPKAIALVKRLLEQKRPSREVVLAAFEAGHAELKSSLISLRDRGWRADPDLLRDAIERSTATTSRRYS